MQDQPDGRPTRKVTGATAGAAVGTVLVLGAVWFGAPDPPAGFEGAVGTVAAFLVGYFVREQ